MSRSEGEERWEVEWNKINRLEKTVEIERVEIERKMRNNSIIEIGRRRLLSANKKRKD